MVALPWHMRREPGGPWPTHPRHVFIAAAEHLGLGDRVVEGWEVTWLRDGAPCREDEADCCQVVIHAA